MRRHITIFFLLCLAYFISCSSQNEQAADDSLVILSEAKLDSLLNVDSVQINHEKAWQAKLQKYKGKWTSQWDCFDSMLTYEVDTLIWEPLRLNFYRNRKNGRLSLLTCEYIKENIFFPVFQTIHSQVEVPNFKNLGGFAVDKESVFHYYLTSSGRKLFELDKADRQTFQIYPNTSYARDKNHVFYSREGLVD